MQLAKVIGDVVATIKDAELAGHKLLILQPIVPGTVVQPAGRTLVAVDSTGAGVGEHVFFVRGREASFPFLPAAPPVDACVVGIVDHWDVVAQPSAPDGEPAGRRLPPVADEPRAANTN